MNYTNVSSDALARLADEWDALTPETQKAARYVLDNPQDVGVSTVREIARAADVKPNTLVRMAQQVGFEGYEDFRAPFREAIRKGTASFPDRARWLQDVSRSGALGGLYADMAGSALRNVEETFAGVRPAEMEAAARTIWASRSVFALGVGAMNPPAQGFAYLASTGMRGVRAIPRQGSTPADDLAWADARDALIAMTCRPWRREVVETVGIAREQGVRVIAISDSAASPIARGADHSFVASVDTPQFFPSTLAVNAILETLLSFVIAVSDEKIVDRVERFHRRRRQLGIYLEG